MPEEPNRPDNVDRLLSHLQEESLAAQLVRARQKPGQEDPLESMKEVLRERLKRVRENLGGGTA